MSVGVDVHSGFGTPRDERDTRAGRDRIIRRTVATVNVRVVHSAEKLARSKVRVTFPTAIPR